MKFKWTRATRTLTQKQRQLEQLSRNSNGYRADGTELNPNPKIISKYLSEPNPMSGTFGSRQARVGFPSSNSLTHEIIFPTRVCGFKVLVKQHSDEHNDLKKWYDETNTIWPTDTI